jgi:hypothetical protein
MKRLAIVLVTLAVLGGCAEEKRVDQDIDRLQQQQDALSAAIKKIQVVAGDQVKDHPNYTKLGRVEGYCFNIPNSTSGQVVHGDSLRAAAYRKYGDQVDAIVNTTIWFVADDAAPIFEPYTQNGYFECAGTAVHFTGQ